MDKIASSRATWLSSLGETGADERASGDGSKGIVRRVKVASELRLGSWGLKPREKRGHLPFGEWVKTRTL